MKNITFGLDVMNAKEGVGKMKNILDVNDRIQSITINNKDQFKLAINGNDLIKAGFKQGPAIGKTLKDMLDIVLDNPELNTRDYLLRRLSSHTYLT